MLYKWCKKIRIGQRIYVKTKSELLQEFGSFENTPCENAELFAEVLLCVSFKVTDVLKAKILEAESLTSILLTVDNVGYIPVCMFRVSNEELNKPLEETKKEIIADTYKEDSVVEEMISKVDKKTCKMLFQLAVTGQNGAVNDEIFEEYIKNWAKAKKQIYLAMGRKFTVYETVDMVIDRNEMRALLTDLGKEFPAYGIHLMKFEFNDFIENKVSYVPEHYKEIAGTCFQKGKKISKCLSEFFDDDKFDIALSKIMQNKKFTGEIVLSIDPMDFLTMSITKHKWASCYNIIDGCYKTCAFSIMQDKVSMIGYRHNKKEYTYDFNGKSYVWNSKQSRNVVIADLKDKKYCMGSDQGSPNDVFYNTIKKLTEELLVSDAEINNEEIVKEFVDAKTYSAVNGVRYHHLGDDMGRNYVQKGKDFGKRINVGTDNIKNPITGKTVAYARDFK